MSIHSQRRRDATVQEQSKSLEDAHKQHMESLDTLEEIWQATRDYNQDVIDRTTRGVIIEDDQSFMPNDCNDSTHTSFKMLVPFRRLRMIE